MELIKVLVSLCSWILIVESQIQYQRNEPFNMDQIYFEENRPQAIRSTASDLAINKIINNKSNNGITQERIVTINELQDSYLQGTSTTMNSGQLSSSNAGRSPSLELQPPPYPINNIGDYYAKAERTRMSNTTSRPDSINGDVEPLRNLVNVTDVSRAVTNFGLNIMKNLDQRGRNVVISPYSIATLLALLQQGALGSTQQQITASLQMTPETAAEGFQYYNDIFKKRSSRNILRVANNVYVADAFELSPAFKKVAVRYFGSEVTPIRFSRPEQAVREINNWVAVNTNNKIQELLTPNAVGENSQLVLVNAVYFKGLWQVKFKAELTQSKEFHFRDRTTKNIPFMRMRGLFKAGVDQSNNAHVVILPFENAQYSLMIVLPSEVSSVDALISSLTDTQLTSYHEFKPKEVSLEIPKFTIRGDTELNPVLRRMGITNVFGQQSELSGLGTYLTYSPQLSSALHTAMLSIDEDGGSAAAATAFMVVALSYDDPSLIYKANRPFLAVLWDNQYAMPLFMAKIENPTV